ncbi:MAG: acyloxyacyl hydrolase [Nitrospiraceae bacterium]
MATVVCLSPLIVRADEPMAYPTIGTQTVGLVAGPFFPLRLLPSQSSKLFGTAAVASWSVTLTDPIGSSWYRGQIALGAELLGFGTSEPKTAYGVGATPKLEYRFTGFDRLRPYVEGGGGPIWTDLGGRVPEQPGQFNFVVWGGAGCAWRLTPQWALNVGYRFVHISNAGTRTPNSGLNFGLPLVGLSYYSFP